MQAISCCLSGLRHCLWDNRASVIGFEDEIEEIIRDGPCYSCLYGCTVGVGPCTIQEDYFTKELDIDTGEWYGVQIPDAFSAQIARQATYTRCELAYDFATRVVICIGEVGIDVTAAIIDSLVGCVFCASCPCSEEMESKGAFFCGAACGDTCKIGSDVLICMIGAPFTIVRCCCFEATKFPKQGCIPFPVIEPFFFHADVRAWLRGERMPSDIAIEDVEDDTPQQPVAVELSLDLLQEGQTTYPLRGTRVIEFWV